MQIPVIAMQRSITFIGKINSPLRAIGECPLQESEGAPEAEVIIFPEFIEGAKDIKAGARVLLLTWLHLADRSIIKCRPRNNQEAPLTGVFSTRSPDRPNPIGVHLVNVISVNEVGVIKISALEVLDQTPVIDIKPVIQ